MKKVVVLRGVPGSGKTTWVKANLPGALVVSADDHFVGGDGVYNFNPAEIGNAHASCFRRFIAALQDSGDKTVVVDNTATSLAEVAPYLLGAQAYGYEGEIITLRCDPTVAGARNIHGVPEGTVVKMAAALDAGTAALMPWWKHQVVEVG